MELIGKLKEKVEKAESKEEKKAIIAEAGVALTEDELEKVAGGVDERHLSFSIPDTDHVLPIP